MSPAGKNSSAQPDLFGGRGLPARITVGPYGIAESWLARELGLSVEQLHSWHDGQLGAPRDYRLAAHYFYTADGVRRILQLAGIEGVDVVSTKVIPTPTKRNLRRLLGA